MLQTFLISGDSYRRRCSWVTRPRWANNSRPFTERNPITWGAFSASWWVFRKSISQRQTRFSTSRSDCRFNWIDLGACCALSCQILAGWVFSKSARVSWSADSFTNLRRGCHRFSWRRDWFFIRWKSARRSGQHHWWYKAFTESGTTRFDFARRHDSGYCWEA